MTRPGSLTNERSRTGSALRGKSFAVSSPSLFETARPSLRTSCSSAATKPPYPGILLNSRSSDQNASAYISAPRRNGAPGSSIGALSDVK